MDMMREADRLRVTLCGIPLDNPVIPASGTFGFGYEFAELYDINRLGTFSFKGTTREPRFGNPTPRIAECAAGMINAVGLQNPGVERVIAEELPKLRKVFGKPVMANVSGFGVAEYAETCALLDREPQVGWLEVNISCPNVHGGGMSFGTDPKQAAEVTRAVKKVTAKPVIMKLSPNVTDIAEMAKACEDAGADGISLINTLQGMRIDLRTRRPVLANVMGGVSGPCVFPVALRMVWQVCRAVRIPVIGRRLEGGGRAGDDDGRRGRRGGGGGQPGGSPGQPEDHRGAAGSHGSVRHPEPGGAGRRTRRINREENSAHGKGRHHCL